MYSRSARVSSAFGACVFAVATVAFWGFAATAYGQFNAPVMSAQCGTENLLSGKRPTHWQDVRNSLTMVNDETLAPEGAQWDAPVATIFETGAGSVTFDLGQAYPVGAIYLQADANDSYKVMGSIDGTTGSFKELVEIDSAIERGHGLRGRTAEFKPVPVRFIRVGEGLGDGFFSVSEFAAYCRAPSPFPPTMRTGDAPAAQVFEPPWYKLAWWQDKPSARLEMCLALAVMLLLIWSRWVERTRTDVALPAGLPGFVFLVSVAVYVGLAALVIYGADWLPDWLTVLACALSCLFSLIVYLPPTSPLVVRLRRLVGRGATEVPTPKGASGASEKGASPAKAPVATGWRVRRQLWVLAGVLSFQAYWNFGAFHFGNYIHYWDSYHYYVGSKYFKELGYDRLYDCASIADAEDPRLRRRVELRKIMNLRTNMMEPTTQLLAHPESCKSHFTPQRWESFKKDIEFFRNNHGVKRWEEAQTDHGYNGTPVWNIAGTTLANLAPASKTQIWALTLIDPLFILGMVAMIGWAFGWRALVVALAVFGTNFPSRFYWTGGAFLRWDWLFYMTAGVCLLKKNRPLIGGFFLAYSALLRVFPMFLLVGPGFVLLQQLFAQTAGRKWWQRLPLRELPGMLRRLDRKFVAVVLGALLAVGTLVPLSFVTSGGPSVYKGFLQNSKKHTATPLTNYMGWRTIVAYKESEAGRYLRSDRLDDPWGEWKLARLRTFHERVWLYVVGILVFAAFLYKAVRETEPWVAAALASMLIGVIPELTCYYYSFLVVPALLWLKRREAGIALLAVTAATGFIDMAPTQLLPRTFPWGHLRVMPEWLDEQYTWMSVATLAGFAWLLYEFGYLKRREPAVPEAEAIAESLAEPNESGRSGPKAARRKKAGTRRR